MANKKILLIDDSATVRQVVEAALTRSGYWVQSVPDLARGIDVGREFRPDLLLLDEPGRGEAFLHTIQTLHKEPALQNTPIVVLANREERLWEEIQQHIEVTDLIAKPFQPEVLVAAVEGVLHRHVIPSVETIEQRPTTEDKSVFHDGLLDIESFNEEWLSVERELQTLLGRVAADAIAARYGADPEVIAQQVSRGISAPDLARRVGQIVWEHPLLAEAASLDLIGDLAAFPSLELFRVLARRGETGVLQIAGVSKRVEITFRQGRIDFALAKNFPEHFLLGRFIIECGLLSQHKFDEFLKTRNQSSQLIGEQLVELGYLNKESLHQAIWRQSLEILFDTVRWTRGRFFFDRSRPISELAKEVSLALDVEGILLEGTRRVEQWYLIERQIPHFGLIFTRNESVVSEPALAQLTTDEAAILDLVNGKANVHEVIKRSNRSAYEVARLLYRLAEARFIRPCISPIAVS